ncbi:MAG: ABC transporter permease [Methylomicrobium sp.]
MRVKHRSEKIPATYAFLTHMLNFCFAFLLSPYRHAPLIMRMVKREVVGRYRGSWLGLIWSFVTPVLMLAIYTFVFSFVFKARWDQQPASPYEFALVLFAGLIVFNLFSECVSRAPMLILQNTNYVKKIIFPLEILPWVALGSALFHAGISLLVLLIFLGLSGHTFTLSMLWLPLIWLPFVLLIVGLSWFLASLGVFLRDINQIIGMLMTVLLFMCPIFYPLSTLPDSVSRFLFLNPLTLIVEQTRAVLIWGRQPDWSGLSFYTLTALAIAWLGWVWFNKTRKGFADVL